MRLDREATRARPAERATPYFLNQPTLALLFPASRTFQQHTGLNADHVGQLLNHVDAGAIDTPLQRTDVGAIDAGVRRERLLRKTRVETIAAQIPRKYVAK